MRRRLTAPPASPARRSQTWRWQQCRTGDLPAEALSQRDRDDLLAELHTLGWSDAEIAVHTCMSTYTTARIRDRLGLAPNAGKDIRS